MQQPLLLITALILLFRRSHSWSLSPRQRRSDLVSWFGRKASFLTKSGSASDNNNPHSLLDTEVPVLFEDERLLAVNKPTGISHQDDEEGNPGILSIIRHQQQNGLFPSTGRLYGVHRLDRVTSGVLVFAKDPVTAQVVIQAFRDHVISKYYVGLSSHKPTKKQGLVVGNMVRGRRKTWYLTRDAVGDNVAKSRFFTAGIGHFAENSIESVSPRTLMLFKPQTGKTHQLRVAAKSVGLPLLGDPVYSDSNLLVSKNKKRIKRPSRTYLHSAAWHLPASPLNPEWTIWSQPDFQACWDETGKEEFQNSLDKLLHKRCDCEPVMQAYSQERIMASRLL